MSASTQFIRKPYTGSCHCGHVKYIVYLSLPTLPYPKTTPTEFRNASRHRIYKCNCTICQKAGIFHIRALDPANDFLVISPKNPMAEGSGLKGYVPQPGTGTWHFCEYCGIRCFSLRGTGYNDEVELPSTLLQRLESRTLDGTTGEIPAGDGETVRVSAWRPKMDWHEQKDGKGKEYLSINGMTLDAHNENLDLRQLHENGYVAYVQNLGTEGGDFRDTPYFGGIY